MGGGRALAVAANLLPLRWQRCVAALVLGAVGDLSRSDDDCVAAWLPLRWQSEKVRKGMSA